MISKKLKCLEEQTIKKFPFLTYENFYRILLLYYGINYNLQDSFANLLARSEIIFSLEHLSKIPILTHLRKTSPFSLIDSGSSYSKTLLYMNEYADTVFDYDFSVFDMRQKEPFYFFVREINGSLVMKLNPIQLCDFFRNTNGNIPCTFCFRNDLINRLRNISGKRLVAHILDKEKKNGYSILKMMDEITIITGSYKNDEEYIREVSLIIRGLKNYVSSDCRVVVGSHEGKGEKNFLRLKKAGVTDFTMSVESFDDKVRRDQMRNRKGLINIEEVLQNLEAAISIFGEDHVIIRLIAGMGDKLDKKFRNIIKRISTMGKSQNGPIWNVNIYMPFTHYLWRRFSEKPFFELEYLFEYFSILDEHIDKKRFYRFKISP